MPWKVLVPEFLKAVLPLRRGALQITIRARIPYKIMQVRKGTLCDAAGWCPVFDISHLFTIT